MTPHQQAENDWTEWKRTVLDNGREAKTDIAAIKADVAEIKGDIQLLKYKASLYGAASGAIAVAILKMVFR